MDTNANGSMLAQQLHTIVENVEPSDMASHTQIEALYKVGRL